MPADRHDLPALDRLTADVAQAMRAAERAPRARWWRRMPPLVVALLALAVPSAVALHATTGKGDDRTVDVPGLKASPGAAVVAIARGAVHGHHYVFAAQQCGATVAVAFAITGGASASRCDRALRTAPILSASAFWSPGQTWIHGIASARVARVDFRVVRQRGGRLLGARWITARTRPFDPRAVLQGHLPDGLRFVLLYRPRRSTFSDAVARDARGRIVYRCAIPGISRTAGSPTAAAARRPCA
jgi:hypothetical protein